MKLTEKQEHALQAAIMMLTCSCLMLGAAVHQKISKLEAELDYWSDRCIYWVNRALESDADYLRLLNDIENKQQMEESMEEIVAQCEMSSIQSAALEQPEPAAAVEDDEWGYDFGYVVRVVGAEARGEPFEGMMAVAQCIRETSRRTGMTPEQVIKVPNQYASPVPESCMDNMDTVNEACLLVFGQGETVVNDTIEYFCAVGTSSSFHNSLRYVCTIGSHIFYSSK